MIEERRLARIEAFGTLTVQASKQMLDAMLRRRQFPIELLHRLQQFADRALQYDGIVGKRSVQRHGFLHHASMTLQLLKKLRDFAKKKRFFQEVFSQWIASHRRRSLVSFGSLHLDRIDALQNQLQVGR